MSAKVGPLEAMGFKVQKPDVTSETSEPAVDPVMKEVLSKLDDASKHLTGEHYLSRNDASQEVRVARAVREITEVKMLLIAHKAESERKGLAIAAEQHQAILEGK